VKKKHDYIHHYRGYWSDGGKCRIRIFHEVGCATMVICSQLPDNDNTSVTNMAEYLAAEVVEEHSLPTPLAWIEHYPEHEGEIGEHSLVRFSSWKLDEVCVGGVWRCRVGSPRWSPLRPEEVDILIEAVGEQPTVASHLRSRSKCPLKPDLGTTIHQARLRHMKCLLEALKDTRGNGLG
jgi:hypothetical protein